MRKPYEQACPIARTLDLLGDRWTLLIIRDLFLGHSRFSEFLRSCPGLPPKLLSERLKRLTDAGLAERAIYREHPLRAEYRLTEEGRSLLPVLSAIGEWGLAHMFPGEPELAAAVQAFVRSRVPELASGES
jgi:DNA-binding HxlR family transcriptional regulator